MIDVDYLRINQKNQEKAEAFDELHEAGFVRIKYESLKQLQEDAEKWNNLPYNNISENIVWLYKSIKIVERLEKLIEELHKDGIDTIHRTELQKIMDGPKPYEQIQDEKANDDRF